MNNDIDNVRPDEAQDALDSIVKMEESGWRHAVPDRWFGAGVALLIGSMFAIYALQDPYPYIVFPILGLALFITAARDKSGAYGRDFPSTSTLWPKLLVIAVLIIVFFGSIYIRRAFDAAWVPLVVGLLIGLMVFMASEGERRAYLARIDQGKPK